jgi:hypothetical protein
MYGRVDLNCGGLGDAFGNSIFLAWIRVCYGLELNPWTVKVSSSESRFLFDASEDRTPERIR